uniref:U15-Theraphotoxin-Sfo1a_1 n=1 Tax=Selenotholus foelschei TaxID=1905327 RepID=A0A482Z895_9ARAC
MASPKLIATALAISYLLCVTVGQQYGLPLACGEGEIWDNCRPPCPKTCKNMLQISPLPMCMIKMCTAGCACKPQYVRNEEGKCVYPSQCNFNRQ